MLIKLRGDREVAGTLHAYDGHMNMVLSDVTETITIVEAPESPEGEPVIRVKPLFFLSPTFLHKSPDIDAPFVSNLMDLDLFLW